MKPSAAGVLVATLALLTSFTAWREAHRPGSVFLRAAPRGEWIRDGDPFFLVASEKASTVTYATRFAVREAVRSAPLVLRTTGPAIVRVDGRAIAELPDPADWNEPHTIELAPAVAVGEHRLEIEITHAGANALVASLDPFAVETGTHWLARARDGVWRNAAPAAAPTPSALAAAMLGFERPARIWLVGAAAFALGFAVLLWRRQRVLRCSASRLRFLLLGVWALVAANDFLRLPSWMGMDYDGHLAYVKWIVERRALPLATDGWEMFQSPLYYLLCAGIAALTGEWNGLVVRSFRLISIASALAQIEIAYRLARRVLPEREDLQKVAIVVSGLLPMGFAVSQGVGNEPLHGALSALTLLLAAAVVQREGAASLREAMLLGVSFGLALLTKVTAALLAAPLCYALWLRLRGRPADRAREWASAALAIACALAVSGWYYARNWIALGAPFALGTPATSGPIPPDGFWWQEPGYRTASQLLGFGAALVRPFGAATHGFWDNYYATLWADGNLGSLVEFADIPPWNYAPMLASVWVAIVPSALIALGLARALVAQRERGFELVQLGALAFATQLAAALLLFVRLPIYSQGKATYMLGVTPIFGILAASGCRLLERSERARIAVLAGLAGWAALVLCSYVVI